LYILFFIFKGETLLKRYNFIKTMVLFAALSGNVLADLNDGLVAYYPFDGDAKDASGNGNDGTVHGATLTEDRFGNTESAYNFDGKNDSIKIADDVSLDVESLTMAAWIYRIGNCPSSQDSCMIFNKESSYEFAIRSGNTLQWALQINGKWDWKDTKKQIPQGKWVHVVLTFDNSIVKSYVDNELVESVTYNGNLDKRDSPATISGRPSNQAHSSFYGAIDEIRIYNRALSESEIQQLYNAKEEENEQSPIEISSKATYYSKNKTLYLESILVPFIDEFSGEETDIKGIFDAQLKEKNRFEFELIPSSITFNEMFEGEETSGYILYDHKKRSVKIPCFKVMTIAKFGNGIEGKPIYYKDVLMKQRHVADLIFNAEDMTKVDSCN
jgi:hypothetical protein